MTPNMVVMAPWVIGMPRAYILSLTRSLTCIDDTKEAVINKRILEDYNNIVTVHLSAEIVVVPHWCAK